jgi:hypothetical protein
MHTHTTNQAGFKRQVVFRISADDWPLLESAAAQHGSIQAAILAGLRALAPANESGESEPPPTREQPSSDRLRTAAVWPTSEEERPDEELTAAEAAAELGVMPSTVKGYIRSGRLKGHYDEEPTWRGWVTSRAAVRAYRAAHPR